MAGPLQVIAVGFGSGADFEGRVLAEVGRLQGRGVLRLLDLLFVAKDEDGTIRAAGRRRRRGFWRAPGAYRPC